jgi:urease gamma subunit
MAHDHRHLEIRDNPAGQNESVLDEEDAMEDAAQALRQVEVEAVQPDDAVNSRDIPSTRASE